MSSDVHMLGFFPTPYPDEILYSVLCRYHFRNGVPTPMRTNREIWGKPYGKGLFLPDGIGRLAEKMPGGTGLTVEKLMNGNTIYPFLKPFITQKRCEILTEALANGNPNIYNILGFSKIWPFAFPYLRYCPACVKDDKSAYGEAYWRRLHQLPGIHICPKHGGLTVSSYVSINMLRNEYHAASALPSAAESDTQGFSPDVIQKLTALAVDAQWLLRNGGGLGQYDETDAIYDALLLTKGYRDRNGRTHLKRIGETMADFYGQDFLALFDAYNSGTCIWAKDILQHIHMTNNPIYHLLLIRFLAGSAENFFTGAYEKPDTSFHPFGTVPWPCRNPVCEFYLQNVIEDIDISVVHGTPRGKFVCPHCGFTYRRKKDVPSEKRCTGQIDIVDYGELWYNRLEERLLAGVSINKTARELSCDTRLVVRLGIGLGIFPEEQEPKKRPYIPKGEPQKEAFEDVRAQYRQRWLSLRSEKSDALRHELLLADGQCYSWLRDHDADWFRGNLPPSKKAVPLYADRDDEYLERVKIALADMKATSGKPPRITVSSVSKRAGIYKLHEKLASGLLPKTDAFMREEAETLEQWRKRKIVWAIDFLIGQGRKPTNKRIMRIVGISGVEYKKLAGFAAEYAGLEIQPQK